MAAPAPPGAARPLPSAAQTRFTIPAVPGGGYHALHEDRFDTPHDNPAIESLSFLDWDKPAPPAAASSPRYQLQGTFLAVLGWQDDAAARHGFYTLDVLCYGISHVKLSTVCYQLGQARIFEKKYDGREAFCKAVADSGINLAAYQLTPGD